MENNAKPPSKMAPDGGSRHIDSINRCTIELLGCPPFRPRGLLASFLALDGLAHDAQRRDLCLELAG